MKRLQIFFLSFLILLGCDTNKLPEGVLSEQKMVNVLTDLTIIDGYMSTLSYTDTLRMEGKNFYATVYKKHEISKAVFDSSMKYYSMQPVLLDSMYNKVNKKLEAKQNTLNKIQIQKIEKQAQTK